MSSYRNRLIVGLMSLQVVFALIFTFAFVNYVKCRSVLNLGLHPQVETGIIMGFAILSMINVAYELGKVD